MLAVERVSKRHGRIPALRDVSLAVGAGEIVGLVGMSGSGKSTLAACILGLTRPDSGSIAWHGRPLADRAVRAAVRRCIQPVFQDPRASLNPRWTVRDTLREPLRNWFPVLRGAEREARLHELLHLVALTPDHLARNPHELSTGQCQRVCLARALAPRPDLLILDEPLSALDVVVQARLLDLLRVLRAEQGLGYLFISHDIAVVAALCDRVAVMQAGRIVEQGPVGELLGSPAHSHTIALIEDSLPILDVLAGHAPQIALASNTT